MIVCEEMCDLAVDKSDFTLERKPSELVAILNDLGVIFLAGGSGTPDLILPEILLSALASSPEARLRLALIPLLLAHPEFAEDVDRALQSLSPDAAIVLRCYYTAAYWLQLKYRIRLADIVGVQLRLPDLFGEELGLVKQTVPDNALHALALRQQRLTGRAINWLGTYEHAVQSWLRFMEQEDRWQHSPRIPSTYS